MTPVTVRHAPTMDAPVFDPALAIDEPVFLNAVEMNPLPSSDPDTGAV
jgi:hypothetical protein